MEVFIQTLSTILESFDFSYCIVVNVFTYICIQILENYCDIKLKTWNKRLVLLIAVFIIGMIYYSIGVNNKVLLNSSILAPVAWSWILKPICKYFNIDYKKYCNY